MFGIFELQYLVINGFMRLRAPITNIWNKLLKVDNDYNICLLSAVVFKHLPPRKFIGRTVIDKLIYENEFQPTDGLWSFL